MNTINFGIIGGGWRTEFYMRIAEELPSRFIVSGVVVRDAAKGAAFEKRWNVRTFRTAGELVKSAKPAFVVLSVPWKASPNLILELAALDIPVLAETPPAPDIPAIDQLMTDIPKHARVQVAEQYPFQPHLAAALTVAQSGKLGIVSQVQASLAHGYHGMVMLRKLLGVHAEAASIRAFNFTSPIVNGPGRNGPPEVEEIKESAQTVAHISFGKKLGVFDFSGEQYFSWIRSPRLLVRGDRGEINNDTVRYLKDFRTPVRSVFFRENAGENGNLEGHYLKGIMFGDEWIYRNPFIPARLTDDEIAVAACLEKMNAYVSGGDAFYGLAEASYDHYLGIMMNRAANDGTAVDVPVPSWMR
ncbi:MAG: Gfo/Idh/MocA family oxidoreductase [Spirochaetes bacterium]|nr:Gfo/Idh/MocA family oxidoreductase [Spirochaetota bacterium]